MKTFRSIANERSKMALCLALLGFAASTQAQLQYQWSFDTAISGTTVAPNVAAGGGGGLNMIYGGAATDLYGPVGSGVSGGGMANDRAFANNNTTYGVTASSGIASSAAGDMNLGTLTQFTMSGWIKADYGGAGFSGIGNAFPRLFMIGATTNVDTGSANAATLAIYNNSAGQTRALQLRLGNISGPNGTDGALSGTNTLPAGADWTFFAVTVDTTISANNVNFYIGDSLSLGSAINFSYNNAGNPINGIAFGTGAFAYLLNRNSNLQRGFDGWGDDFRLYNGVLDSAVLDSVRLAAIPEPGTATVLGLGAFAGIVALRRRRS